MESINSFIPQLVYALNQFVVRKIDFDENQMNFIKENSRALFSAACRHNYFDLVKKLITMDKEEKIIIWGDKSTLFSECCQRGDIIILEPLYEVLKDQIDIQTAFIQTCKGILNYKNNKQIVKFLYDKSVECGQKIDIHINNEESFRLACVNDHLETAQYLYEISIIEKNPINIRIMEDFAFKWSCDNYSTRTAEWLCTLCTSYLITGYDSAMEEIYYEILCYKKIIEYIYNEKDNTKLDKLYKDACVVERIKQDDYICPVCLSETEKYQIKLSCNHTICIDCFIGINKCYINCQNNDFDKAILLKVI
ncbi:MAG: hypothetical protein Terrestrivirus12_29 [Terrestrivirus sp.]|uniref:RING-type domain-containing protein n=1 Tax=Terrestrivirus sp. TaxID=2487775 RepID=A0A3G4ZPB7_9VIRU|nr:MAG: hypothetical protein Terrestrivirus12_29 [Terrestrivirus sp.]